MMSSLLFALALIAQVIAVKITTPNATTNWTSPGPNIISWIPGSGDPATFNIQLAQNNISAFSPNLALPADGIFGTAIPISALINVFVPSCVAGSPLLPTGSGFTLKFLKESEDGSMTLLTTSQSFNITEASVTECAPLAGTGVPMMPGGSVSSAAATSTSTASIGASGDLSTSSTSSHLGTIIGSTIGALIFVLLVSGAALWVYKGRRDRRRQTAQFGMKVTQRMPQMQSQARENV
ncbi:hypothetical protein FIBSPDRAFT_869386 [Athelia psychrophila]|uniref:Mid2 domain-containing protein n=1 Tax=Athelia psychrophila TaxID=1759441 RepID=A0A166C3J0_9AGAM|nr:hypothetical protein FIBSPDRAFT_869386 [Fibularhizoctonia sp. CBS 109695]